MDQLRNEEGNTLIEVTIAIASAAILMLGVMASFTTSSAQDRDAYEETRTQAVATSLLEQIEGLSFEEVSSYAGLTVLYPIERWTFVINIEQIQTDLLAVRIEVSPTSDDGTMPIVVTTMKTIKDETLRLS